MSDHMDKPSMLPLGLALLCLPLTALAAAPSAPTFFTDDFSHGLAQWSVEQMPGGTVTAQSGTLSIEDAAGATVWFRSRLTAPVEINYEATVVMQGGPHDRLSDLNCFWMAQDPTQPAGALPARRSGKFSDYDNLLTYYVGYGGNNNTTTRFRRYDGTGERPLLPAHDRRDAASLLIANHVYWIKIVVRDGTTEYWRDGEKLFTHQDPHPLTSGFFAFRTVRSHLVIRNFTVKSAPSSVE